MQLFYTPDVTLPKYTLDAQESRHAVRVLRLGAGERLWLTDGRGNLYTAQVTLPDPGRCEVEIIETQEHYGRLPWSLTMAVAPTKNPDRYEWFLEKATEVGCSAFIPIATARGERRTFNAGRGERVVISAMKQSLKACLPALEPVTDIREVIVRPFSGGKFIAYCGEEYRRVPLRDAVQRGGDNLILIGPEGDFSPEEVAFAVEHGFIPVSLGESRLRTETAALAAVVTVSVVNQ